MLFVATPRIQPLPPSVFRGSFGFNPLGPTARYPALVVRLKYRCSGTPDCRSLSIPPCCLEGSGGFSVFRSMRGSLSRRVPRSSASAQLGGFLIRDFARYCLLSTHANRVSGPEYHIGLALPTNIMLGIRTRQSSRCGRYRRPWGSLARLIDLR